MDVAWAGPSNGSATVYVLDTGVEMHPDLPGLAAGDRLSALPGINPTGCYAHATHVAGIIGAADNGTGVVGVLPSVKIVSIAVETINSGPCSTGFSAAAIVEGLEKVYQRAICDQKVAIVNISINSTGTEFWSTGTIGLKMSAVATASFYDGAGYRGALIVQSGGNYNSDACGFAYGPASASDGILVVGGFDSNGQRVLPLLGRGGYINTSDPADDEAGSNSCVEVWAPSQRVLSTWPGGTHTLSGTSMAAPHIAGLAARLVENDPSINTSDQLETAVRGHLTTIGGSNLQMARLANVFETALPTVEIAEGENRSSAGPINFSMFAAQVNLRYDAIGAQYCIANVTKDGYPHLYYYTWPSHNLGVAGYPPGNYSWTITCFSPQGTQTTVVANGYIKRSVSVAWRASTTSTGNVPQVIPNGGSVYWSVPNMASFVQANESTGADYCHILVYGFYADPGGDPDNPAYYHYSTLRPFYSQNEANGQPIVLWDSLPYFFANYQHATFYFGYPQPYQGYKWLLRCWNTDGVEKTTVMYGKPQ